MGSVLNTQASSNQKIFGAFGDRFAGSYIQEAFGLNANSPAVVYGFAGREYDFESGLSYNLGRMYNPDMGRFTQKDPIGFAGEILIFTTMLEEVRSSLWIRRD